ATVVVDVVDLGVALGRADALLGRVFCGLDVDAVGGAGGRAQEAGDAFLEAVLIALQLMLAAVAFLEDSSPQRPLAIGIVLDLGGGEALAKRDAHPFGDTSRVTQNRHSLSIRP